MQGRAHVLGIRLIQSLILASPLTSYVSLTHYLNFLSIHLLTCNIRMIYSGLTFSRYLSAYVVSLWKFNGDSSWQLSSGEISAPTYSLIWVPLYSAQPAQLYIVALRTVLINRGIQICSGRRG